MNQAKSKQTLAETRWEGFTHRIRPMRSLAWVETLQKCSSGKLKSPRSILLFVSSLESSKNGDKPLKDKKKRGINMVFFKNKEDSTFHFLYFEEL